MMPRCMPKLPNEDKSWVKFFRLPKTPKPEGPKKKANSFVSAKPTKNLIAKDNAEKERTRYKVFVSFCFLK